MCQHCEAKPTVFKVPNWYVSLYTILENVSRDPNRSYLSRTYAQIRNAVPAEAFDRSTTKSLLYFLRDVALCSAMAYTAYQLDAVISATQVLRTIPYATLALRYSVWAT